MASKRSDSQKVVVIGAGIGGLTTAAVLADAGLDVTVLEAYVYPGGCAGTFYHRGYRFDAGATLAGGFYPGGPMDLVARATGVADWRVRAGEPAMLVHLPDGCKAARYGDERRHAEYRRAFGPKATRFWQWQERTADALWALALHAPTWPPANMNEALHLSGAGLRWLTRNFPNHLRPELLADAFRPVAAQLHHMPDSLRLFVDAQLLIAAQTTSLLANALYGASALDLPRRGVVHVEGGMGAIAERLVEAVKAQHGRVLYRQSVARIVMARGRPVAVTTARGESYPADLIIANLSPWNIAHLLGEGAPPQLRNLPAQPADGWGAFMVYAGVDDAILPAKAPFHHQVIVREPMGEGNTIFISASPAWDKDRAPAGRRAITISTHTALKPWWQLFGNDRERYAQRKQAYAERILIAAERALPNLRAATDLVLPGTPVTFQRFTRRWRGWVGGFPQTHLLRTWRPNVGKNLWLVGDSIFPGQSIAAVALGGLRVAETILSQLGVSSQSTPTATTVLRPLNEH